MSAQRPPINYYGSKVRLAPWIATMLPPHHCYVEPFFDEELYPDWWRVKRTVHRPWANRAGGGDSRATEVIWCNRPLPAQLELRWARSGQTPEDCEPEAVG